MTTAELVRSVLRFMDKVTQQANGCWLWTGAVNGDNYGRYTVNGKPVPAHRVSWEWLRGPISAGLVIDHLCKNTRCVNPEHLEPVTAAENTRRASRFPSHCPYGHQYTAENTYFHPGRSGRVCRQCKKERRSSVARVRVASVE